jgi:hypothetical protein
MKIEVEVDWKPIPKDRCLSLSPKAENNILWLCGPNKEPYICYSSAGGGLMVSQDITHYGWMTLEADLPVEELVTITMICNKTYADQMEQRLDSFLQIDKIISFQRHDKK